MLFHKLLPLLALGITNIYASPLSNPHSIVVREPNANAASLPSSYDGLQIRQASIIGDLGTIFAGLDNLAGTFSAAINSLLKTFFAGGSGVTETANAIAEILDQSQPFADALATVLKALRGCN